MARIPDAAEHKRTFASVPFADRRAIARAVNRGVAVQQRKHAPLAVGVARRQRRLWRWAWLAGPLIGLIELPRGWVAVAVNAVFGTLMLGVVARFWYLRAARAEAANLALADGKRRRAEELSAGPRRRRRSRESERGADGRTSRRRDDPARGSDGRATGQRAGHLPRQRGGRGR